MPCCAGTRRVRRRSSLISTPRCDVDRPSCGLDVQCLRQRCARQIKRPDGSLQQCSAAFTHIIYYGWLQQCTAAFTQIVYYGRLQHCSAAFTGAVARPRVPRHDEGAGAAQPSAGTPRVLTGYSQGTHSRGYSQGTEPGGPDTRGKQANKPTNKQCSKA